MKHYEECLEAQHELIRLLGDLGFLISWKKVISPTHKLPFLGVTIDTSTCTLSLDEAKLSRQKTKVECFRDKTRANMRQLQSLAGSLNWACQAVRGGRFFLRRVLDVIKRLRAPAHKAKLDTSFKEDVMWWLKYLCIFNGVVYYRVSDAHYNPNSIKSQERLRRGTSDKIIVAGPATRRPYDFKLFLKNDTNKRQLCQLLLQVWGNPCAKS